MIKKMFFVMSASVVLHGMQTPRKKTGEIKSKKLSSQQSPQEIASSSEDNDGIFSPKSNALSKSGKASVKSLNDLKDVRRAQNEFRDKAYSKSDSVSGKK
jgi:hypothetical protein